MRERRLSKAAYYLKAFIILGSISEKKPRKPGFHFNKIAEHDYTTFSDTITEWKHICSVSIIRRVRSKVMMLHVNTIPAWGLFYYHGLTLIPAWISNYIHYKVWDEITYAFLNFNGATVEV